MPKALCFGKPKSIFRFFLSTLTYTNSENTRAVVRVLLGALSSHVFFILSLSIYIVLT